MQASDFPVFPPEQVAIGRPLFFDPILSGNRNISCATRHSPEHGTFDGLPLGIGEGGMGIGPKRTGGEGADRIRKRIPRNASALWNLGAKDVTVMFHAGRVRVSDTYGNGLKTPAQEWLPEGLESVLAAQAPFPLTSQFEMAGNPSENEVAGAVHDRIDNAWPIHARCIREIQEYAERFAALHDANALAALHMAEFQRFDSRLDAVLVGEATASCGHSVTSATLDGIVRHRLEAEVGFAAWTPELAPLPEVSRLEAADFLFLQRRMERARLATAVDTAPVGLDEAEVAQLPAFLHALTGTASVKARLGRSERAPGGLEVEG